MPLYSIFPLFLCSPSISNWSVFATLCRATFVVVDIALYNEAYNHGTFSDTRAFSCSRTVWFHWRESGSDSRASSLRPRSSSRGHQHAKFYALPICQGGRPCHSVPILVMLKILGQSATLTHQAALAAGKHVVEKPLVPTSSEATELINLASANKLVLATYQNRRWDSDFLTVRRLLDVERVFGALSVLFLASPSNSPRP